MLEVEEARERIFDCLSTLPSEGAPVSDATGRIVAEPVVAPVDLPLFDNSAMDGFAVRATDLAGASREKPVALRIAGEIAAGGSPNVKLKEGRCVRVFTGSILPTGADAVVMQEEVTVDERAANVLCFESIKPWENVRLRGEDVKKGAAVLAKGERIGATAIGLLGALGLKEVSVARRPVVGLLATGNELREPGESLEPGTIYESNRAMLLEPLRAAGALPRSYAIVADSLRDTSKALEEAFAECDAVITSGGVSVGQYDFVKKAFEQIGGELNFWRVAIKPGKPFVFGRCREKLLFGLPGNPVSAFVTFLLLVRPALLRWQGANQVDLPGHPSRLAESLANRGDRRHFMRVHVDSNGEVRSAGTQASHALGSLAAANGLVDVAPNTTLQKGETVRVLRWEWGE